MEMLRALQDRMRRWDTDDLICPNEASVPMATLGACGCYVWRRVAAPGHWSLACSFVLETFSLISPVEEQALLQSRVLHPAIGLAAVGQVTRRMSLGGKRWPVRKRRGTACCGPAASPVQEACLWGTAGESSFCLAGDGGNGRGWSTVTTRL